MEYGDILYSDVKNVLYITHVVHDIDICGEKECDMKNCKNRIKEYFEYKVEE